ncbi:kinase-like (PK-like) [Fusarium agapanthi]|uniref:Kinase-like (PK-like) n=1 Tax=Fusarium agapanthi TaxID=1803897 RepID=A0A9P5BBC8_9HYPO|nr:kinase-like (PK-like) [Fusarium agapanthi]
MERQNSPPTILIDSLPKGSSVTFKDSTFFIRNGLGASFPSTDQVRAKSEASDHALHRKNTIIFESLGLVVKFRKEPRVTIAKACVPVSGTYGWTKDAGEVFLYMQLVNGMTLEKSWDSLSKDKAEVGEQLRDVVVGLRRVKRDPENRFLEQINRGPLQDVVFADGIRPRSGPFHLWGNSMTGFLS